MAISDETLALAIPPELKTDHPDAALVVQGILIAIAANENSGGLSAKGRMRDTFAALQSVFFPIFQAHIAKEDEDWGALNRRVQIAESEPVTVNTGLPEDIGEAYQWRGEASDGTFWLAELPKGSNLTSVKVFSNDRNSRLASGEGDTPVSAIENAYLAAGKRAEVMVPEPEPAKANDAPKGQGNGTTGDTFVTPDIQPSPLNATLLQLPYALSYRYQRDGVDENFDSLDEAKARAVVVGREGNGAGTRRPDFIALLNADGKTVNTYRGERLGNPGWEKEWINVNSSNEVK